MYFRKIMNFCLTEKCMTLYSTCLTYSEQNVKFLIKKKHATKVYGVAGNYTKYLVVTYNGNNFKNNIFVYIFLKRQKIILI